MPVSPVLDEATREFLIESAENLDRMVSELVELEKAPAAKETLASVFRTVHTIKGTCGFLGFGKLESVSHAGESLLAELRDGKLTMSITLVSTLLDLVDACRLMLSSIEATGSEGDSDHSRLIEALEKLRTAPHKCAPEKTAATKAQSTPPPTQESHSLSDSTLRVDVDLLDKLMGMVGELVLARNQVLALTSRADGPLLAVSQRLNHITTELQGALMKTRMQPIDALFGKMPRVVRDLALSLGKEVDLETEGNDTELDKTLLEAIKDPLIHLLRNAIDHGIESPKVREAQGKARHGRIALRAYHESGLVNLSMSDDGAGIDPGRVCEIALQSGLVTKEQAQRLGEKELLELIFVPGFSTTDKITHLSGRGVGMDVVKNNIEKIGGLVDVESKLGAGTTFQLKIPLTLAIVPALIVSCNGDRFAIPQVNLLELIKLGDRDSARIETIPGASFCRWRDRLLPIVCVRDVLFPDAQSRPDAERQGTDTIVVLQAGDRRFGLLVEGIADTAEIVVKPLGKQLRMLSVFAGATILGDGKVALILDVLGFAQRAELSGHAEPVAVLPEESLEMHGEDRQSLLVLRGPDDGRLAIPLSLVERLERFPRSLVEKVGGNDVVQYRGGVLPLLFLRSVLHERRKSPRRTYAGAPKDRLLEVVVHAAPRSGEAQAIGLVADQVLDIIEGDATIKYPASRKGVLGSIVLDGRVTELLDIHSVIREGCPTFYRVDEPPRSTV